jgi:hypothetical protein
MGDVVSSTWEAKPKEKEKQQVHKRMVEYGEVFLAYHDSEGAPAVAPPYSLSRTCTYHHIPSVCETWFFAFLISTGR